MTYGICILKPANHLSKSLTLYLIKRFNTSHLNSVSFHISKSHATKRCTIVPSPFPRFEVIPTAFVKLIHFLCQRKVRRFSVNHKLKKCYFIEIWIILPLPQT